MGNQFFTQPSKTFQRPPTPLTGAGFRLHDRFCFSVKRHEREGNKTTSGKRDRPYIQFHAEGQKPSGFIFPPLRGEWKLCLFNLVPISEALNTLKVSICAKRKSWQEHSAFAPSHLFRRDFIHRALVGGRQSLQRFCDGAIDSEELKLSVSANIGLNVPRPGDLKQSSAVSRIGVWREEINACYQE